MLPEHAMQPSRSGALGADDQKIRAFPDFG
jgi:hypothetical protein